MDELFRLENFSFTYPRQDSPALDDLTLSVRAGEFLVLCGPSGCGKSTLLTQLKTVLAPHGTRRGTLLFRGKPLDSWDLRSQSQRIGFVRQDPDSQIVTDKVWHELAFGLESLGCETPVIRRRVAEMASFFGIQTWFHQPVSALSGGQKQLLNLASVMVLQPDVLILDEPTSQLDPIAASDFLGMLGKINRELGTTVLLTEHRLEEAFPLASRVVVLDRGRLAAQGSPRQVGEALRTAGHHMFLAMPTPMRVWAAAENPLPCPVTIREGRDWLADFTLAHPPGDLPPAPLPPPAGDPVLTAREVWFSYEKEAAPVVRGLSLEVRQGEFVALLGGNGTGKTTSLSLLGGLLTPNRGEILCRGSVALLPQDPQTLFVKKTLREDLLEVFRTSSLSPEEHEAAAGRMAVLCQLETLLDRHPYDLSGGEQQRAALAKVLLTDPAILLLDEPTKGLDAAFKETLAGILRALLRQGVTILMVSHDVEFCARHTHRCALFFDGAVVTEAPPRAFFSGNAFYTTAANRMSRGLLPGAVTPEDLISALGGQVPPEPPLPEGDFTLPQAPKEKDETDPGPLPRWRKALAAISGAVTLLLFFFFTRHVDLTSLTSPEGIRQMTGDQLGLYGLFLLALFVFAGSVTRRSRRRDGPLQTPPGKRTLPRRTLAAMVLILLLIPLTLFAGEVYLGGNKYYLISLLILLETMIPFFLVFEGRKPQARELVLLAVLCAIGVAGRAAFFMLPSFKPVLALAILAGVAFGGETGFLVGSMTMLVSNILFSQGPWTPWLMFAAGIIGFLAGILFRRGVLRRTRLSLSLFGAAATLVIYGGIMNPASALLWAQSLSWELLVTYYIAGFPMDCVHAASTWLFLWFGAEPLLEKLDRIKIKYGLVE